MQEPDWAEFVRWVAKRCKERPFAGTTLSAAAAMVRTEGGAEIAMIVAGVDPVTASTLRTQWLATLPTQERRDDVNHVQVSQEPDWEEFTKWVLRSEWPGRGPDPHLRRLAKLAKSERDAMMLLAGCRAADWERLVQLKGEWLKSLFGRPCTDNAGLLELAEWAKARASECDKMSNDCAYSGDATRDAMAIACGNAYLACEAKARELTQR